MIARPTGSATSTVPKTSVFTVVRAVSKTVFIASVMMHLPFLSALHTRMYYLFIFTRLTALKIPYPRNSKSVPKMIPYTHTLLNISRYVCTIAVHESVLKNVCVSTSVSISSPDFHARPKAMTYKVAEQQGGNKADHGYSGIEVLIIFLIPFCKLRLLLITVIGKNTLLLNF